MGGSITGLLRWLTAAEEVHCWYDPSSPCGSGVDDLGWWKYIARKSSVDDYETQGPLPSKTSQGRLLPLRYPEIRWTSKVYIHTPPIREHIQYRLHQSSLIKSNFLRQTKRHHLDQNVTRLSKSSDLGRKSVLRIEEKLVVRFQYTVAFSINFSAFSGFPRVLRSWPLRKVVRAISGWYTLGSRPHIKRAWSIMDLCKISMLGCSHIMKKSRQRCH